MFKDSRSGRYTEISSKLRHDFSDSKRILVGFVPDNTPLMDTQIVRTWNDTHRRSSSPRSIKHPADILRAGRLPNEYLSLSNCASLKLQIKQADANKYEQLDSSTAARFAVEASCSFVFVRTCSFWIHL